MDKQKQIQSRPRYLIEGAVTEYEPSQSSIAGGYGWGIKGRVRTSDPTVSAGNVFSQVLSPSEIGGLFKKDHIAMNIHLVEMNTNTIIASTAVEASPKDLVQQRICFSAQAVLPMLALSRKHLCRKQFEPAWLKPLSGQQMS